MKEISFLRAGVAPAVLGLALISSPVFAQTTAADETEQPTTAQESASSSDDAIIVTGSIFRRTSAESASPVTVLSAESLEQRGLNTIAEAVQRVSANGAGTITQGWNNGNNFATGANAVSLRGLTVQSTLTVFDGQRMAPYPLADDGHRNFVDMNTIPSGIIERIDILRDGASSTYGADAVAGVVNVITKKQIQGLHMDGSVGISEKGDAAEQRFSASWGYGDLEEKGFNFYVAGEYQRNETLWARDRQYPFNTADLSKMCGESVGATTGTGVSSRTWAPGDTVCMANGIRNSVTPTHGSSGAPYFYNGLIATIVPTARPVDATGAATGQFNLLNTAAGCRSLTPVNVPSAAQIGAPANSSSAGTLQCMEDARALYSTLQPEQERLGFSGRFTAKIGDRHEFYAQANYYQTKTHTQLAPRGFTGNLPPPNPAGFAQPSNLYLPVYVCSTGVGSLTMLNTGCTAANGVLNPNNPYAASGQRAQVLSTYDRPQLIDAKSRALRGAIGISGSFGDDWGYNVEATASQSQLDITQTNYIIPQRLWNAIARGEYNMMNPGANTQAVRDYIAPVNENRSVSDLWQVSASIQKDLFQLPGGPLAAAVGVAYRHESIDNPSANPENLTTPYDRYWTVNAVGAVGSRNVKSAYYEVSAPILDILELSASGRYDSYSSGQENFSPKFGAKFKPIPQIALRGTFSKGFRIPSFNEAYGLPTTGYVNYTLSPTVPAEQAFILAHGSNAYATGAFAVGLTSVGNPNLDPERSTSWTAGAIIEPIRNVSFTVDWWRIKVKDIIGGADYSDVRNQYYSNNGIVNIPGITVVPGTPDINFPNALPHLGFIQYSFQNNDSQTVSGLDFGANVNYDFSDDLKFISSLEASYLIKFEKVIGGDKQRYDGTLSPCDVTSCSGSPKWRGSWQNTLQYKDFTLSATAYYTSGYDLASIDYGGIKGDCLASLGGSVVTYQDGHTPVLCKAKATWNLDMAASVKIADKLTVYANVMNVLGIDPPHDPSAAYNIFQFNPAWAGPNIMGRYFRLGAKVDF